MIKFKTNWYRNFFILTSTFSSENFSYSVANHNSHPTPLWMRRPPLDARIAIEKQFSEPSLPIRSSEQSKANLNFQKILVRFDDRFIWRKTYRLLFFVIFVILSFLSDTIEFFLFHLKYYSFWRKKIKILINFCFFNWFISQDWNQAHKFY